ncbi:ATP-binding protein [Noviherbaspirillum sp.]|uniref:ATP-binding protein n=1 Tax=Noviherbaspirillum sp. TaxID=1926288 RepID=UPI002FDF35EB
MIRSLRVRLLLLLGAAITIAAVVQFITSFRVATEKADKLFDYHMQQMAIALEDSGFESAEWSKMSDLDDAGFDFVIQIWTDDGVRVYQSRSYRSLPPRTALGYSNVNLDNGDWRVYTVQTDTRVVQVSQKMQARHDRAFELALSAVWPVLPVSLLLFAAAWWVVTTALSPLNRIGHDLANRNADSLAPVSDEGVPQEVSLLVGELNLLLARMAQSLDSQQRFVADAAHELRSPLTALKLQVQTLARAKDDNAREHGIARLLGGVDRASRLVEQLLALARQDPSVKDFDRTEVSLPACIEQAVADVAPLALARHIHLEYDGVASAVISGDLDSLRMMMRNLVDNAVRYTPEHGRIRIGLITEGDAASLRIEDSGRGIPESDRERVFDRFYRVPGTSASGSGLGLAIAKAIADRHQAAIELGVSTLGGLAVRITFRPILHDEVPTTSIRASAAAAA